MRQRVRSVAVLGAISLASAGVLVASRRPQPPRPGSAIDHLNTIQKRLISGTAAFELDTSATGQAARSARAATSAAERGSSHHASGYGAACEKKLGGNVKVNQNCLNLTDPDLQGRGQAQNETWIAVDPNNSAHSWRATTTTAAATAPAAPRTSLDGGRTWADTTTPNGFTRGDCVGAAREYWQAGGDTSVAWDTKGNAYLSCQVFNRGAPTHTQPGPVERLLRVPVHRDRRRVWNFPGRPVAELQRRRRHR